MIDSFIHSIDVHILTQRSAVCILAVWIDHLLHKRGLLRYTRHPVSRFGSLAASGERLFNKPSLQARGLGVSRFWRGLLWCGCLLLVAALFGLVLELLLIALSLGISLGLEAAVVVAIALAANALGVDILRVSMELSATDIDRAVYIVILVLKFVCVGVWLFFSSFLCAWLISHTQLDRCVATVERQLRAGKLGSARLALSHIVGRETSKLSRHAVARAAMESLAENFSDGTIAPLMWYVFFGLPGLFLYKAANTLDSQFGYRGARYGQFGRFAARIDDLLNLMPARVTAYGICLAAFVMRRVSGFAALRGMWRFAPSVFAWWRGGLRGSPNAPHPEAALAGALNITLAGERTYNIDGETRCEGGWIGTGTKNCNFEHIANARRVINYTMLFFVIIMVFILGGKI